MAFDDKIYLAFSSGNDGTGVVNNHLLPFKTFDGSAKALVEAGAVGQYEIIFTESTSENCNLFSDYSDINESGIWCRITFLKGVIAQGVGTFMKYNQGSKELEFHGCVIKDYTYFIERYNSGYSERYSRSRLYNCYLENVNTRPLWYGTTVIDGCYFKNALIESSSEVNLNSTRLIRNTTFDAATLLGLVMIDTITILENVIFKRSSLSIGHLTRTNVTINRLFFEDCSFRFAPINVFNGALEVCNNVAEFEAKWLADTGSTASTNWTENINFGAIEQTKGLLDNESYYIDKKAVGYGRYGLTYDAVTNIIANSDFIVDSGKIKRNVATDATLVFNIDLVKAVRLRRVFLHYDYLGGAEFPNNVLEGGAVKFSIETSFDGISYNSPFDYYGGVDINADLNLFDNVVAKSLRVSITISGADVGELLIESLSVEYQDYPSLENYNCKQLGAKQGHYLSRNGASAYNEDINPYPKNAAIQAAIDATGIVPVGTSEFTAQELDLLSAVPEWQRTFKSDVPLEDENTNMDSLLVEYNNTDYEIYTNEAPEQNLVNGTIQAITSLGSGKKITFKEVPCSRWGSKVVKFRNKQGGVEYLYFTHKDKETTKTSSSKYLEFEDGYKNTNGDIQRQISLYRDDFPIKVRPLIEGIDNNQNVWFSDGWQISEFSKKISLHNSAGMPLEANELLVKIDLSTAEFNAVFNRFDVGDRVTFSTSTYTLSIFGTVAQYSNIAGSEYAVVKFTETTTNQGLSDLFDIVANETNVSLTAFDAWMLCTFVNRTVIETSKDYISAQLTLLTNPEQNYII